MGGGCDTISHTQYSDFYLASWLNLRGLRAYEPTGLRPLPAMGTHGALVGSQVGNGGG